MKLEHGREVVDGTGYYLKVRDWPGIYVLVCTVQLVDHCVHKHSAILFLLQKIPSLLPKEIFTFR